MFAVVLARADVALKDVNVAFAMLVKAEDWIDDFATLLLLAKSVLEVDKTADVLLVARPVLEVETAFP